MHLFDFVLVSSPKKPISPPPSPQELQLKSLCEKGCLPNVMEFLSANKNVPLSLGFRTACEYGHLPLAKVLLAYKPTIDVGAHDNYAFRYAYANGHLETAHWLWVQLQKQDYQPPLRSVPQYSHK